MSETRDKQTLNCSDHETETATGLCTTCQVKLCEFCTSYHQRSARFKGHMVQSVEMVSNEELFEKQPIKCTTHNEEMKYFCEDCQESICGECVLSKCHKSHVFGSLDKAMKKEVTALKKSLKSSENVTKVYNEYLESAKDFHQKSDEDRDNSKRVIKTVFNELISMMEAEKEKLLRWVDESFESSSSSVNNAEQMVNHVETMRSYVKDVINYPACEVFDVVQAGAKRLCEEVARMKTVSSNTANDTKNLIYSEGDGKIMKSEGKYDINLLSRRVVLNVDEVKKMKDQILSMKSLFTTTQCRFPDIFQSLQLKVTELSTMKLNSAKYSEPVMYKGFSWKIDLQQGIDDVTKDTSAGVFLHCWPSDETNGVLCKCPSTFRITMKNHLGNDRTFNSRSVEFSNQLSSWGWPNFLPWKDLMDPTQGFIKNDSITISAEIRGSE